jgi:putative protein-disulfide isomerase
MSAATLHYIYDPLCGWCYGAAPLVRAAADTPGLQLALHAGGMLAGPRRHRATPEFTRMVQQHVPRLVRFTGQEFGAAYLEGLAANPDAVFDSEPPITAILAAGAQGLALLACMQRAHFVLGRAIWERPVLDELAAETGIADFAAAYEQAAGEPTWSHIAASLDLLGRVGGAGFPTFALEHGGQLRRLDSARYLGHPGAWRAALTALVA